MRVWDMSVFRLCNVGADNGRHRRHVTIADIVSPLSNCSLGDVWSELISQIYPVTGSCQCRAEVTDINYVRAEARRAAVYLSIDNRRAVSSHQRSYCSRILFSWFNLYECFFQYFKVWRSPARKDALSAISNHHRKRLFFRARLKMTFSTFSYPLFLISSLKTI